jgi:Rieske Fe-S protein
MLGTSSGSGSSSGGSGNSSGGSGSSSGSDSGSGGGGGSSGGDGGTCGSSGGMTCTTTGPNVYAATFSANPDLNTVGKGVTVSPPNYSDSSGNDFIWVVQESAGSFIAFSLSCTHQGCVINPIASGFLCPCHGTTFSPTGVRLAGPGTNTLQCYPVCSDSTGVYITLT